MAQKFLLIFMSYKVSNNSRLCLSKKIKTVSLGHRNPQGLYFDKKNNFILETEHGPAGGDEINLIETDNINKDKIQNFGWAISSAGEHYGAKSETNKIKYKNNLLI